MASGSDQRTVRREGRNAEQELRSIRKAPQQVLHQVAQVGGTQLRELSQKMLLVPGVMEVCGVRGAVPETLIGLPETPGDRPEFDTPSLGDGRCDALLGEQGAYHRQAIERAEFPLMKSTATRAYSSR